MERTQELIRNTSITVGTDSTVISTEQNGTQRTVILITNTSTGGQAITVSFQDEATAGQGIVLYPGGSVQDTQDAGYIPSNKQIYAVSSAAGGTLAIHERILMRGY